MQTNLKALDSYSLCFGRNTIAMFMPVKNNNAFIFINYFIPIELALINIISIDMIFIAHPSAIFEVNINNTIDIFEHMFTYLLAISCLNIIIIITSN